MFFRIFLFLTTSILPILSLAAEPPLSTDLNSGKITVYIAKKIITLDPGWPTATAVAVKDGKILSVGTLEELTPWLKTAPYEIDKTFANKILVPGFIEAHGHPLLGGLLINFPLVTHLPLDQPYSLPFPGVKTYEEGVKLIKKYVDEALSKGSKETVFIWGWDVVAMNGKHLDKNILDSISTSIPVIVWDASEHFAYANTLAIEKSGVTTEALNINGVQAGPDGKPNGQFLGVTAMKFVVPPLLANYLQPDRAIPRMESLLDMSIRGGITTQSELVQGSMGLEAEQKLFKAVFDKPDVKTRCVVVTDGEAVLKIKGDQAYEYLKEVQSTSNDILIFRGVKFFSDDSFVGLGMNMENPGYTDGRKGIFLLQPGKEIFETMLAWWKAGFHIHIHTNGNAGNSSTIQALADLQAANPRFDHRFTIEHHGMTSPDMSRKIKALGGIVSINPYYVHYRGELNAPMVGADRAALASRLKTNLDNGVVVSLHSDTPIGPPRPLEWMWIATTRHAQSGKVLAPEERVTPMQALKMVTIDAAYTLGVEDRIGSIEAGKFADFTVLEKDPLSVKAEDIRNIPVWGTVVGGRKQAAKDIVSKYDLIHGKPKEK